MTEKVRASFLSLTIIMVLVFSAVSPTSAYADGGATDPPATPTSNPGEPGTEETDGTDGTSAEPTAEPVATETSSPDTTGTEATPEPVATETSTPDATSTEVTEAVDAAEPPAEEPTSDAEPTLMGSVPDDTSVTVLDENGDVQPLATQETMDIIATSDPIWCPGGQDPSPGANGCTESFTSFDGLLTFLSQNPQYQGAGTIYIQQGAYQGNDPGHMIDFNSPAYDLSNINNADLNVVGGWNTSTNAIDPNTPSTFTSYSIHIGSSTNPWGGSLSLSNISMGYPNRDHAMNGIELVATGDINLDNVSVTNAGTDGGVVDAGGNVNVKDSDFSGNRVSGLIIRSAGNVAVANSAFGNEPNARHQNFGLTINSGASTSLFNVLANQNRESGADITAGGRVTIGSSVFSGTKHIIAADTGDTFLGFGLRVVTPDSIEIDNVTGNDNFLWGALLDAGGDIAVSNSVFNENTTADPGFIDDTGLFINGGASVALNNVVANNNRLYGTQINADGTVSINNSTFNNNRGVITTAGVTSLHGHGMQVNSLADIFINNTNATGNLLFGGELTATGEVAVSNSDFSNTNTNPESSEMAGKGLAIVSGGNTSLAAVTLDQNQTVGADIQAGGDVYLDTVTATDNGTDGVTLQATCTHVFGGTYTGNGQYGLNLGSSALEIQSAATFGNNAAGDMFPEQPVSCGSTVTSAATSSNLFATAAYETTETATGPSVASVSLNSLLANTRTGQTGAYGMFIGRYFYTDTTAGLQIFALDGSSEVIAMVD